MNPEMQIRELNSSSMSTREIRESPRYGMTFYVRLMTMTDEPTFESEGDVGIGGFCFEGFPEIVPGTKVELFFFLPDFQHVVRTIGEVIGQTPRDTGLGIRGRFTEIGFDDERLLARWLDKMNFRSNRLVA